MVEKLPYALGTLHLLKLTGCARIHTGDREGFTDTQDSNICTRKLLVVSYHWGKKKIWAPTLRAGASLNIEQPGN